MKHTDKHIPTPIELFGVECHKGWYKLIEPIFNYIEQYNRNRAPQDQIQILQVKEKFGQLRFYVNFSTEHLSNMIEDAEKKSYDICEFCGTEDNVGSTMNGWIWTICLDCLIKDIKANKIARHYKWYRHSDEKVFEIFKDNEEVVIK